MRTGAISVRKGMLPEMNTTEPYSPSERAKASAKPVTTAGRNHYRPRLASVAAKYDSVFPRLDLVTIDTPFGGWTTAQATHFADGGTFDQIYQPGR